MKRTFSFCMMAAALAASACTTKDQNSSLVITLAPLATNSETDNTKPAKCGCAGDATTEPNFTPFGAGLTTCLVIENRLPSNAVESVRLNTNDFQLQNVRVSYEVIGGGAAPAEQLVPATALIKAENGKAGVPVNMVPAAVAAQIQAGATVRLTLIGEGELLDGSKVKTNAFEHLVKQTGANLTCN